MPPATEALSGLFLKIKQKSMYFQGVNPYKYILFLV